MANLSVQPPLKNVHAALPKLYSAEIPERHLIELKKVIAKFLMDKARDKADTISVEKIYSNEKFQQVLDN